MDTAVVLYLTISSLNGWALDPITYAIIDYRIDDINTYSTTPCSNSIRLETNLDPSTNSYKTNSVSLF